MKTVFTSLLIIIVCANTTAQNLVMQGGIEVSQYQGSMVYDYYGNPCYVIDFICDGIDVAMNDLIVEKKQLHDRCRLFIIVVKQTISIEREIIVTKKGCQPFHYKFYPNECKAWMLYTIRLASRNNQPTSLPITFTNCSVENMDAQKRNLPFDAEHSQFIRPILNYKCDETGHYKIYVKLINTFNEISRISISPQGYSFVYEATISKGTGKITMSAMGGSTAGHWRAGTYKYEFYYNGTLIYTYPFNIPSKNQQKNDTPFIITSCKIINVDKNSNELPFDAAHTRYLKPIINYDCTTTGTYKIYISIVCPNGTISRNPKISPSLDFTTSSTPKLYSGSGTTNLIGWGNDHDGNWEAGTYRIELYNEYHKMIYTHRFIIPQP